MERENTGTPKGECSEKAAAERKGQGYRKQMKEEGKKTKQKQRKEQRKVKKPVDSLRLRWYYSQALAKNEVLPKPDT